MGVRLLRFTCAQKFVLCFVNFFLAANLFSFTFLHCSQPTRTTAQAQTPHNSHTFLLVFLFFFSLWPETTRGFRFSRDSQRERKNARNNSNNGAKDDAGRVWHSRHLKPHTRALNPGTHTHAYSTPFLCGGCCCCCCCSAVDFYYFGHYRMWFAALVSNGLVESC